MIPLKLLPTLVTPEWTSTAASHLNDLQASSCTPQLWQEAALLEQLIYKNINQHGNTRPFQRLLEVRRLLRLFKETFPTDSVCALRDALLLCSRPTLTVHERNVPTAESAFHTLQNVLGSCRVAESLANKTLAAAFEFTTQLAQSFFMPLSLTCLSIIARVRALSGQLLVDLIRMYNCCIELTALLPLEEGILTSVDDGVEDDEDGDKNKNNRNLNILATMPQMLRCSWTDGRPTVIKVDSTTTPASDLKLNQQRPQLIIARGRDSAGLSGNKRKQSNRAAPPSDLAVIEDRGVAVSREHLLAELRQQQQQLTTTNDAAAAVALYGEDTTTTAAPAYARTEVNLAATEAGGKISLVKEEKPKKKKMNGPRITIIPDDDDDDGSGGDGDGGISISNNILKSKKVGRRLEPLPPRTTAFISVESLQKKPKVVEEKKKIEDASAAVSIPQPAAPTTTTAPPPQAGDTTTTEVKSWEDWLAPIGGSDKKETHHHHQQQQIGSSGKKKKKNRRRG